MQAISHPSWRRDGIETNVKVNCISFICSTFSHAQRKSFLYAQTSNLNLNVQLSPQLFIIWKSARNKTCSVSMKTSYNDHWIYPDENVSRSPEFFRMKSYIFWFINRCSSMHSLLKSINLCMSKIINLERILILIL